MMAAITVGTTPTLIIPSDKNRDDILIQNTSDADVFLCFDASFQDLTINNGFKLSAGSSISLSAGGSDGDARRGFVTNAIYGISADGDKILRVQAQ